MDDIVRQAMVKWPNVPHCHGWLGLDARGNWYLRDAQAQALGGFASGVAGARGTRLRHERLIEFIQRNYAADEAGRWFFQNGDEPATLEWLRSAGRPMTTEELYYFGAKRTDILAKAGHDVIAALEEEYRKAGAAGI